MQLKEKVADPHGTAISAERKLSWLEMQGDLSAFGQFKDSLRQSVAESLTLSRDISSSNLLQAAHEVIVSLLASEDVQYAVAEAKLESLFVLQKAIYENAAIARRLRTRQYICASGLILSPDHCITSIRDTLRMRAFIRGIDQGLSNLRAQTSERLHLVYPACGPFAPLLLPLLSFYQQTGKYTHEDLSVTLIDLQEGAVASLWTLINKFGLQAYMNDVICMDALEYRSTQKVHMVVLEAMQHGFSREGHFALARHFGNLLHETGIFIPQEVSVRAVLNVAQREFVDQWNFDEKRDYVRLNKATPADPEVRYERTEMGEILKLDAATIQALNTFEAQDHTQLIECGSISIPPLKKDAERQLLMLVVTVNTFGDEWLNDYESGITHPLPDTQVCVNFKPLDIQPGDLCVQSGDTLTFYYCLNGLPGFLATLNNSVKPRPLESLGRASND